MLNKILLFLVLILLQTTVSPQETNQVLLGVVGDQTGTSSVDSAYAVLEVALKKMSASNPNLILHLGDMVESRQDFATYENKFSQAVQIMQTLKVPWYISAGDHDVTPPLYQPCSQDRTREMWFKNLSKKFGLPENLYYSFSACGYHFISLYTSENLHTDPRWGTVFLNKISDDQIAWLKNDLENHKNSKGIIIFMHHPVWYVWSNWYNIHNIIRQYPVIAVLAGHFHVDQDDGTIDNIRYMIMGATGGNTKNCDVDSGGCAQYALLTLENKKIKDVQIMSATDGEILEFTPRQSTDRLQALQCMLSNVFEDEYLTIKDGVLNVSQINLESIGNPIDIPITVEISADLQVVQNCRWHLESNTLQPGENIGWSNYSNVGHWNKKIMWSADIKTDSLSIIKEKGIAIQIKVSFQDTKTRSLQQTIVFSIY